MCLKFFYLADTFACLILGPLARLFWISIVEANAMYIPQDPPLVLHLANLWMVSIVWWQFETIAQCPHLPAHSR